MSNSEEGVLEFLVEDIMNDSDTEYDPDDFYNEAVEYLSTFGYELTHEIIWEFDEEESSDIYEDHLEIIAELEVEGETSYLRFVLEDGRRGEKPPKIDRVNGPKDFDYEID